MRGLSTRAYDLSVFESRSLRTLWRTQELSSEFCIKHVLDAQYAKTEEDRDLAMTLYNICRYQDHLALGEFCAHYELTY